MFSLQAGIVSRFYKWKQVFSYCSPLLISFWAVISDGTLATLQVPRPGTFKIWACGCRSGECRAAISSQDWDRPSNKPAALDTHTAMQNWAGRSSPRTGQVLGSWRCQGLLQFQLSGLCIRNVHRFYVMLTFHSFFKTSAWSWQCSCLFQQLFFLSHLLYYFVFFPKHFPLLFCLSLLHIPNLLSLPIFWDISHGCCLLFAAVTHCLPTLVVGHK